MSLAVFDCSLCGTLDVEDVDWASDECLTCDETICGSCITDEGVCVPCDYS